MKKNRFFVFFFSVLFLLIGISALFSLFPKEGIKVGGRIPFLGGTFIDFSHVCRFPQFPSSLSVKQIFGRSRQAENPLDRMKRIDNQLQIDPLASMNDFDRQFFLFNKKNPARIYLPDYNVHYFDTFFASIDSCVAKGQVVHVLHYGDSQIEADRITSYIREKLQTRFGGSGPGLLPAVQPIHSYTVRQWNSPDFERFMADGTLQKMDQIFGKRYGALAQFARFKGNAGFYVRSKIDKQGTFSQIRLFVGNTSPNFRVSLCGAGGAPIGTKTISDSSSGASVLTWNLARPVKSCTVNLSGGGEVYGIALDAPSGVAVDNVPMRGSRGTFFTRMDKTLFTYMHKMLNSQLILLEFGGNAMPIISSSQDILAYGHLLDMQIKWIQSCCPGIPIILLGPSDMGETIEGKVQTRKFLAQNVQYMAQVAARNHIAFWNMYDVMGGHNSMVQWAQQNPPLAMTDFTHLSNEGAKQIAKLFMDSFFNYYEHYHLKASGQTVNASSKK